MIDKIRKRNGKIVDFDQEKITEAIWKAAKSVGGRDRNLAQSLSDEVVEIIQEKFAEEIPGVENIQDIVEKVLIETGHATTAKAYILYRKQHETLRKLSSTFLEVEKIVSDYLSQVDWRVRENSNIGYSMSGLLMHVAGSVISNYTLDRIYPMEVADAHRNGDFHLHDLYFGLSGYCAGWSLKQLLYEGFNGVPGNIESNPPKHLDTALLQMVNFIGTLQNEWAGAQAFNSIDTYLAPFIRKDSLSFKETKQAIQKFVFNLNITSRWGSQSLVWDELVIIKNEGKIEFIEIGKLVDSQFEKNRHRILEEHPQSYAVQNYDDIQTLSFNKKGEAIWVPVKAFVRHKTPKNLGFFKIRTSKGTAKVSRAHSLFSFEKLDNTFNPESTSGEEIQVSHPNSNITEKNHFIGISKVKDEGKLDELDLKELIERDEVLSSKTYVIVEDQQKIEEVKRRVLAHYGGLTPFYSDFNIYDKKCFLEWGRRLIIPFRIWSKFSDDLKVKFKVKQSDKSVPRFLKDDNLESFVKVAAWFISEGHSGNSNYGYISQEKGKSGKIKLLLKKLNMLGRVEDCRGYSKQGNKTSSIEKIACVGILAKILQRYCGIYCTNKQIPYFIFSLKRDLKKVFLKELLEGDGSEYEKYFDYTTTSRKLSAGLSLLCAMLDRKFSVYDQNKREENWNDQYIVRVYKDGQKKEKYEISDFCARICSGVEEINYEGEYEYDISVDLETENFIGGSGLLAFHNTPFTNLTFDWMVPDDVKSEPVIIGGKLLDETYEDYQKEMDVINRAFLEVMMEGDRNGRPFTFPIPTYNLTRDFDWESENARILFEMTAKYGLPYFSNFINSDLNPSDVRSMCCRLRLNLRQLDRNITGGLFGSGDSTGSVGVVSINMPRLGYLSKNKEEFFKKLNYLMNLAKDSLETKRKIVERNVQAGLLPYTKRYLGTLKNHFSTIGPIGINEACLNLFGKGIDSSEGKEFAIEVLNFMRKSLSDFQEETGHIYNLEAVPAEGTSYRLARIDKKKYPDIITAGEGVPYYTNSTLLPVNKTDDLFSALRHQEPLQTLYTGGTVFHTFLGERMSSGASCARLLKKILYNTRIPYVTITPTFSICPDHGYLAGEHHLCPQCGKKTEVYSRVVGYFRPVSNWNEGKQEEFRQRVKYDQSSFKDN